MAMSSLTYTCILGFSVRFRGFRGEDLNVKVYDVQTEDGRQVMAKVGHVS
jgi:hypothetical protein